MAASIVWYTIVVAKLGPMRFLGHRDWVRTVERALRRCGLPLSLTEGFHPHPRMVLPEPLPLGVESDGERLVLALREALPAPELGQRLAAVLPEGLALRQVLAGSHREPLETPIELRLEGPCDAAALASWVAGRTGALDRSLQEVTVRALAAGCCVTLTPSPGRRVSVGRWLKELVQDLPQAAPWTWRRTAPLHFEGPPLDSLAPLGPAYDTECSRGAEPARRCQKGVEPAGPGGAGRDREPGGQNGG